MSFFGKIFNRNASHDSSNPASEVSPSHSNVSGNSATITIDGTRFRLVKTVDELSAAILAESRGALRFLSLDYGDLYADVMKQLEHKFGGASRQYRHFQGSDLVCAGCLWEFPGSYRLSLQSQNIFGGRVIGATPGFDQFGRTGICPQCCCAESILVYETYEPNAIGENDVQAICRYWHERAKAWWKTQKQREISCNHCYENIHNGEGYLEGSGIICEKCVRSLTKDGVEQLRSKPHYYGSGTLRKARQFKR